MANGAISVTATFEDPYPDTLIPRALVWAIVVISVAPFCLIALGADFSNPPMQIDPARGLSVEGLFSGFQGPIVHTILEWSAFCVAIFTVLLAFSRYHANRDITTPIIGVALFCAGSMDAFHSLAAGRLIESVADNTDLIPFTWAICRVFNAVIMIVGVSIFLVRGRAQSRAGLTFVLGTSAVFGLIAYAIIHYAANSASLPQTMYPDGLITRPWEVGPLLLFLFAGLYLYPKFHRQHPSLFAHSLVISAIPEVVVELHMVFGSTALFDSHFNVAHFLKILAYVVPLLGLVLDYARSHREQQGTMSRLVGATAELKRRGTDLEQSERRLSTVMSNLQGMAFRCANDQQWTMEFVSRGSERLTGYRPSELVGNQRVSFNQIIHPEDRSRVHQTVVSAANAGKSWQLDYRINTMKGEEIWVWDQGCPVYSETGELEALEGFIHDISPQKRAELALENYARELERSNADLEHFAHVASHDLQEPLRMVGSYTQLLRRRYQGQLDADADEYIGYAVDGAKRMQTLLQDLLHYSRVGSQGKPLVAVEIARVLDSALANLKPAIEDAGAEIVLDSLPSVTGDEVQLVQLFQNLIANAIKFRGGEKSVVRISAEREDRDWSFAVEDNGIGIGSDHLDRIFVIFQRLHTRAEYSGTGIGLAICKKIVERHGGRIWVESEEGTGSRFRFTLKGTYYRNLL